MKKQFLRKSRIVSFLLAWAMVLTMLPMQALAVN